MKKKDFLVFLLFFFLFKTTSFAEQKIDPELLAEKINKVLSGFGENINIGILVQDAKTGRVLYKKDGDRYFMPASTQKLFTAFAALKSLGPDFSYSTQVFADYKKIKKGRLHDNLYIQFSGDPTLTEPQFELLMSSLSEAGIRHIKGKVIIDDSAFDQMTRSPGTSWEDQDFCWGAPISGLFINHNCVNATLIPAALAGEPVKLELPPYPQTMTFINEVVTQGEAEKNCLVKAKRRDQGTYTLSGCMKTSQKPRVIEMAIANPRATIQAVVRYLLKKNEITLAGEFEFKKFATLPKPFARQDSPPLKALVATMLKESDNTIANALFKTMGANYAHEPGSFSNGNKAVRDILTRTAGLHFPKTTLIDGAGLSRYNFLKPEQEVSLLQTIFLSPEASDFIASLAIAGVDGTLKDRLRDPLTQGKIHAKTGNATAITSLAGYLETKNKQMLIFSILINGFTGSSLKYQALEDKICRVLVEA